MCSATYFNWKAKSAGATVAEAQQLSDAWLVDPRTMPALPWGLAPFCPLQLTKEPSMRWLLRQGSNLQPSG